MIVMKSFLKFCLFLGVCAGVGYAGYGPAIKYWKDRNRPEFRKVETDRGQITEVVNATGEVKPVLSVSVGSFVSGPIDELYVDFNDVVKKGDVLAEIDPRTYSAAVDADRAGLASRRADVQRVQADLDQAIKEEERANRLSDEGNGFISQSEIDQAHFSRRSLEAQLLLAESAVTQAEANLANSEANLGYTKIVAPVDGTIIDRQIDPGQTLAAQFQTPELFVIAPDMREKMHVFASVDEADIGLIRAAQQKEQPVRFTVDAYPEDLFEGAIDQIRLSPASDQNVVTYPVVVASSNADLKLMPGMTADLSFEIKKCDDVIRIPNAALRYFPKIELVREDDKPLLDGSRYIDQRQSDAAELSAADKAETKRKRNTRHVWIQEADRLRAIEVVVGISDSRFTELVSGDVTEGQELVTGIKPKAK